jgi:hypothetical protein
MQGAKARNVGWGSFQGVNSMASKAVTDCGHHNRRELAASVSQDLRELVLLLTRLFDEDTQDSEVLVHILNAKFAAERGLILSERLADKIGESTSPRTTH